MRPSEGLLWFVRRLGFFGREAFTCLFQAFLQHGDQVNDLGWRMLGGAAGRRLAAKLDLFVNEIHQRMAIIIRVLAGSHSLLMRSTNSVAISSSRVPMSSLPGIWSEEGLISSRKMHQFEQEHVLLGLDGGEVLAGFDDHLGDPRLARPAERLAQQSIGFGAFLLRFEIVRFVEENRINLFERHKLDDLDALSRLDVSPAEVLVLQDDKLSLFILIAFDDLVPRHLFGIGFGDAAVIDGAEIILAQQAKGQLLALRGRVQRDWDVDQAEANRAFPNRAHLFVNSPAGKAEVSLRAAEKSGQVAPTDMGGGIEREQILWPPAARPLIGLSEESILPFLAMLAR